MRCGGSASVALLLLAGACTAAALEPSLPAVNVDPGTVTLSGFDSGAIFATQYQFAFSGSVRGAGLATPVPWACAQNTVSGGEACMTSPEIVNMALFYTEAGEQQAAGHLDNLTNLASHYVSIQSAPLDPVVVHGTSILAQQMYAKYGVVALDTVYSIPNAPSPPTHAWPTSKYGNNCDYLGDPYVNNCGYDYAGHVLKGLFDHMGVPFQPAGPNATFNSADMLLFSQKAYGADTLTNSMDTAGYIFVPPQCRHNISANASNTMCHLHVHFHGCRQSRTTLGASYVTQTELNEHAVRNNIVVLYPQAAPNSLKFNPLGCWDWFGYNSDLNFLAYATNVGVQTRMVHSIVNALTSGFA